MKSIVAVVHVARMATSGQCRAHRDRARAGSLMRTRWRFARSRGLAAGHAAARSIAAPQFIGPQERRFEHWRSMGAADFFIRFERDLSALSPRESEVLRLMAGGASNKLIARGLRLSVHTVKRHVARTMLKLHVSSRAEAASLYRASAGACPAAACDGSLEELTARERDILARVALGATNLQIAAELALSPNTVKRHTANIREKLGVHSRMHAAALLHEGAIAAAPPPG
jgi:DNA-binding CsgD family transcriptional regulator